MKIGYARVSTEDQSLDLQIDALKRWDCDKIYEDRASGTDCSRKGYKAALAALEPGDTLIVWRLDRLARSMFELVETVKGLHARDIKFVSLCEYIDTTSAFGELILHLMGALAHFERALIVERTRAGMAAAKARGVKFGRKSKIDGRMLREAEYLLRHGMSVADTAKHLSVGTSTLYRKLAREA